MQSEERQQRIEEHLAKVEFASLDELSELVDASVSTVRRDLDILESKSSLKRTHGGARLTNPKSDEFMFSTRDTHQLDEKEAIGRACAEVILPNQTVIVDAGTTCFHVARHLEAKNPHIITNSLPVANHFSASNKLEVVVTGGVIYPRLGVLVGPLAVAAFTSVLTRAIRTLWIVLDEMKLMWIPVEGSWRLNERHYGSLQGLDKAQTTAKHGEAQVKIWRRSYDIPPPPLAESDERHPRHDPRYASLPPTVLPGTESLKTTLSFTPVMPRDV